MEQRSLGHRISVSVLGVGCSRLGSVNNTVPMVETRATLEAAIEAGINVFDTADIYGQGDSERLLGRLLARYRSRMFVTTKVGFDPGHRTEVIRFAKPLLRAVVRRRPSARVAVVNARSRTMTQNFSPHHLSRAVDRSRRRLGIDRLDGLFLHDPPLNILQNAQIHEFLHELLQSGKALRVGASVESIAELETALKIPAITMLQVPLKVVAALSEKSVLERIREKQIGLFVRGILRKCEDQNRGAGFAGETLSAVLARPFVTCAIVGVSTRAHLQDLLSAVS